MEMLRIIRLGLIGFAIVGIFYSCIGTGFLRNADTRASVHASKGDP